MIELKERLFTDEMNKLIPVLGKTTAERLSKAYLIGDETTRKRIIEMLDVMKASVLADPELRDSPLLEAPEIDYENKDSIAVGETLYGKKPVGALRFSKDMLMTHVGIFGSSGYGKTNLSYNLIRQLSSNGVPVLIFDFSKKNYRDLCKTDIKDRVDVYTAGSKVAPLRFNPLVPPAGISETQWAKEFSEIFDHSYWLLGGGQHIILKSLSRIYETNQKPVMAELKKHIEESNASTAREHNWIATSLRPLESLCMKETGEMFALADGVKPSSFLEPGRVTVIEMDALSTNDRTFLIEIIMQWLRDWLIARGTREELAGVIVLEEAHHVLNREKSKKIGAETVMDLVFREMRELGLGIIYLDQHPSMVSFPALGNTSTHIYMNLGLDTRYSSDIQDAINMLGLDREYEDFLRRLPVGHAFMLMRNSAWTKPFAARFPHSGIKKGMVRDEEISMRMRHKIEFPPAQDEEEMDELRWQIMHAIGTGKGVFTSQLYKPLKMSGTAFKEKIATLLKSGMLGIHEVRIEKTKANYYFMTDKGEKAWQEKFAKSASHVKDYNNVYEVRAIFDQLGWKYRQNGYEFEVEKGEEKVIMRALSKHDRNDIENSVASGVYYVCATPEIRNILLQHAAKRSNKEGKMKISAAVLENFPQAGFIDFVF